MDQVRGNSFKDFQLNYTNRLLCSSNETQPPRRNISILVMGGAGVGKSSLISKITGAAVGVGPYLTVL
jgi:predicted GTPase